MHYTLMYYNADGTDEAKIPLLTTSNDKENKPVTDASEDEWPSALQGNDYNIKLYSNTFLQFKEYMHIILIILPLHKVRLA